MAAASPLDTIAVFSDDWGMTYPGGKNAPGVYQTIINLMPPHAVYIEPFLGSGAVMRMKRPALQNIGIDADPQAIARWQDPIAGNVDISAGIAGNDDTAADVTAHNHAIPIFTVIHGDAFDFLTQYLVFDRFFASIHTLFFLSFFCFSPQHCHHLVLSSALVCIFEGYLHRHLCRCSIGRSG